MLIRVNVVENTELDAEVRGCDFDQIELHTTTKVKNTTLSACDMMSVIASRGDPIYDPGLFPEALRGAGFQLPEEPKGKGRAASKDRGP